MERCSVSLVIGGMPVKADGKAVRPSEKRKQESLTTAPAVAMELLGVPPRR